MSKSRLILTALFVDQQSPAQVAARYGVHRGWVYRLKARYEAEGEAAFEPRSRRPKTSPTSTPAATVELVLRLRKQLAEAGLDAGADTIGWHLTHRHGIELSRATINRVLARAGAVTPDPSKRPKSSYTRFQADQPNECWQSDFTHYRLATGVDAEIISWLDDHSRYLLHVSAHPRISARIVLATFTQAAGQHGYPASTLTDNGMVYTVRLAARGVHGGRTALEAELARLGITQKNSRPNHPTTCGKPRAVPADPQEVAGRPAPGSQPRSRSCRCSSTGSTTSTTTGARTAPCRSAAPPRPPTPPAPRPLPATAAPTPTTESATTRSTKPAP